MPLRIRRNEAEADLSKLSIVYDLRRVNLQEGLRAALALASMVALAEVLHQPLLLISALAALLACLADPGGPALQRTPWLLAFSVLGGLEMVCFGLLRDGPLWILLPVATLVIGALQLLRIYGTAATQLGNLLTVVLVLAMDQPAPWPQALALGVAFGLGGLWTTLLAALVWRVRMFQPARDAVGAAWSALADMAADMGTLAAQRRTDLAAWEAHARAHRRAVRMALDTAQAAVLATTRQRGRPTGPTGAVIRLEAADQAFGALIALSDLLEAEPALHAPASRVLRVLRPFCTLLARASVSDAGLRPAQVAKGMARLAQAISALPGEAGQLARRVQDRVQMASLLTVPDGFVTASGEARRVTWRARVIGPLAANLDLSAPPARHALRAATVFLPAFAWTLYHPTSYGHWLTITLVLTLQPFIALTWQRAIERIGGTLTGGVIAALLSVVVVGPIWLTLATFPLAALCFALRPAGFGLMMTFLTPLVVLLSELGRPGASELTIALMRAVYTLVGGLMGVGAGLLLWPAREPPRLRTALEAALLAHAIWAETQGDAAETARRAAGRAVVALEASLSRALLETGRSASRLQAALAIDAALRRLGGRLTAINLDGNARQLDGVAGLDGAALRALAADRAPPPPPGETDEGTMRLARQVELIEGAMERFRQVAR